MLIKKGAKVDKRDKWEMTALMHACEKGHVEAAEMLIRKELK